MKIIITSQTLALALATMQEVVVPAALVAGAVYVAQAIIFY